MSTPKEVNYNNKKLKRDNICNCDIKRNQNLWKRNCNIIIPSHGTKKKKICGKGTAIILSKKKK